MQGINKSLLRYIEKSFRNALSEGNSVLLIGSRQTGKTTLVREILRDIENGKMEYYLQDPTTRLRLEADPGRIIREIEAKEGRQIIFVDEAQKVPEIFDAAQYLIDNDQAQFILTGSSARKLRRKGANLLPGRVRKFSLDPLLWSELGLVEGNTIDEISLQNINESVDYPLSDVLAYGSLPAMTRINEGNRSSALRSYTELYLEEEIRAEALSRKIGAFSRFLQLAASESGTSPNFTKLSNESGVSIPTIKAYYQVLEDTLVVERIEPFLRNARKRILSSPRYYFFDTGVRNALAGLSIDRALAESQKGILFEHAVVLEIRRRIRVLDKPYQTYYWRTGGGAEVDCVLDLGDEVIPIEVKGSKAVALSELKGLQSFLESYSGLAKRAYVVVSGGKKEKLSDQITMIPWNEL